MFSKSAGIFDLQCVKVDQPQYYYNIATISTSKIVANLGYETNTIRSETIHNLHRSTQYHILLSLKYLEMKIALEISQTCNPRNMIILHVRACIRFRIFFLHKI